MSSAPVQSFSLKLPAGFDIAAAVCSYGWALLAPNRWHKPAAATRCRKAWSQGIFERPLHTESGLLVRATIAQTAQKSLEVKLDSPTPPSDVAGLQTQIRRMLRLSGKDHAAVKSFQARHPAARACKFGRLLRAPTVWEDVVKCILLCNCGWGRTVAMNAALCNKVGRGAFPTPAEIALWQPESLQAECGLGYRAKHIVKLAQQIEKGEVDLAALENPELDDTQLLKKLRELSGVGPFSATNMLQLLGRFAWIACDSETIRHLQSRHCKRGCTSANVHTVAAEVYEEFAPFQFLAYWFELWEDYEQLLGPIAQLDPEQYSSFTGSNMRKNGRHCETEPQGSKPKRSKARK